MLYCRLLLVPKLSPKMILPDWRIWRLYWYRTEMLSLPVAFQSILPV
jgi:hypothetical protein